MIVYVSTITRSIDEACMIWALSKSFQKKQKMIHACSNLSVIINWDEIYIDFIPAAYMDHTYIRHSIYSLLCSLLYTIVVQANLYILYISGYQFRQLPQLNWIHANFAAFPGALQMKILEILDIEFIDLHHKCFQVAIPGIAQKDLRKKKTHLYYGKTFQSVC